jgi:hypothetical protein
MLQARFEAEAAGVEREKESRWVIDGIGRLKWRDDREVRRAGDTGDPDYGGGVFDVYTGAPVDAGSLELQGLWSLLPT